MCWFKVTSSVWFPSPPARIPPTRTIQIQIRLQILIPYGRFSFRFYMPTTLVSDLGEVKDPVLDFRDLQIIIVGGGDTWINNGNVRCQVSAANAPGCHQSLDLSLLWRSPAVGEARCACALAPTEWSLKRWLDPATCDCTKIPFHRLKITSCIPLPRENVRVDRALTTRLPIG